MRRDFPAENCRGLCSAELEKSGSMDKLPSEKSFITLNIDSGSNFTDCFVTFNGGYLKIKVPTTPHDLSICFFDAVKEVAKALGFNDVKRLLKNVSVIRYVTTHGTNTFIKRTGDRVGVIVTKGYEKSLYLDENNPAFNFIDRNMVIGLREEVNEKGELVKGVAEGEVISVIKALLEQGANILVVSFRNAHLNPFNERKVKEILHAHYRPHHLGFVPLILASEVCKRPDEVTRTNLAILNAYVHTLMASFLYRVEDELHNLGYSKPLMTVHVNGGVVSISKTRPIDTVGSSPVAGLYGSLYWSKVYSLKNVVAIEIGGTSFDVGLIVDGSFHCWQRNLFGLPLKIPMVEVTSIGLAGTSIVKAENGGVEIGPESAGMLPGPACFDAGGLDPTVLDAGVVISRVNPDYFLGGRMKLNKKRAVEAVNLVSNSLGVSVEEASLKIIEKMAEKGFSFLKEKLKPLGKSMDDWVAFVYGGTGPTHCAEILDKLGISKAYLFTFSPVFGAFGSSLMNVAHHYEEYKNLLFLREGNLVLSAEEFNAVAGKLMETAYRDLEGEGFKRQSAALALELEVREGKETVTVPSPKVFLEQKEDAENLLRAYKRIGGEAADAVIEIVRLKAEVPLPHYAPQRYDLGPSKPEEAHKGERIVLWADGEISTPIYEYEKIKQGFTVSGPAILESVDSTYVIPKGWTFKVDEYANNLIEKM